MSSTINAKYDNDFEFTFNFTDGGEVYPITGATLIFVVASAVNSDDPSDNTNVVLYVKQLPGELTNPTLGSTTINIPRAEMKITPDKYKYALHYIDPSDKKHSSKVGDFKVATNLPDTEPTT